MVVLYSIGKTIVTLVSIIHLQQSEVVSKIIYRGRGREGRGGESGGEGREGWKRMKKGKLMHFS